MIHANDEHEPDAVGVARQLIKRVTGSSALSDLGARVVEVRFFDRALSLAARLFIAVIPTALVISSTAPGGRSFADRLVQGMDLQGDGRKAAETLFAAPEDVRSRITVLSVLVVIYALSTYCGALQRMYESAWRLRDRDSDVVGAEARRRLEWVASFVAFLILSSVLAEVDTGSGLLDAIAEIARLLLAILFFGWTPYLLLGRRVSRRRLWPTAILSAVGLGMLTIVAPLYFPRIATSSTEHYGLIGFTFSFFSYLFASAMVTVGAGIVGAWIGDRARWAAGA